MTLNDNGCAASGAHGKQVNTRIQNSADFRMRVLVLSLSDVDPIDDGVLYCCQVQGEAPSGSCCSISVVNTGASDSKGNAVGGVGGNTGRVCTQGGGGSGGGGAVGAVTGGQMANSIANNPGAVGQGMPSGNTGGGNVGAWHVGSGASAPPASQVLPGGGGGAPVAPARGFVGSAGPAGAAAGRSRRHAEGAAAPATPIAVPTRAPPARRCNRRRPPCRAAALPPATAVAAAPTAPPTPADTPDHGRCRRPCRATKAPPSTPTAPRPAPTAARPARSDVGSAAARRRADAGPRPAVRRSRRCPSPAPSAPLTRGDFMPTTLRSLAAFSLGALLAVPTAARAVNMTLEATKSDGGAVRVCVGLDSAGQKVAGTQNDLVWTAVAPRSSRTAAPRWPTRRSRCTATRRRTCRIPIARSSSRSTTSIRFATARSSAATSR